ncbi:MAG: hypothetical protein R8M45_04910 [Ghiorsea sp.]
MFVTHKELAKAFGVSQCPKLKAILAANNIPFFIASDKKPFTTSEALNAALGLGKVTISSDSKLNLDWMNKDGETQ